MNRITEFRCPGGWQRLEAIYRDDVLSIRASGGEPLEPASFALAEAVSRRYATVAAAENGLRNAGIHEADCVLWRSVPLAA